MSNDLLTSSEAQAQFNYSRSSLLRFEEDGLLSPVRPGGRGQRRYPRQQLEALAKPVQKALDPGVAKPIGRPEYGELGTTGLRNSAGQIVEERLRELQGREGRILLRQMRLNDPVIHAVFFALASVLRQANKRIKPASEKQADIECAEYVSNCLDDMDYTWNDTFTLIVEPLLEQGFALLELCYKRQLGEDPPWVPDPDDPGQKIQLPGSKYKSNRVAWWKFAPRSAFTLAPGSEWIVDARGNVLGINQMPEYYGNISIPLASQEAFRNQPFQTKVPGLYSVPINKLLHFRTTVYPDGTPEGIPIHRAAYLPWYYTNNLQEIEGIGAERDLGGIPVIYMGNDLTKGNDPNSDWSLAKDLVTNVRMDEQMGIVFPGPKMGMAGEGNGWLFELASTQGRRQWDISSIIERYDKRKALVVLAQWIMLGLERVGSYALSQSQSDLFKLAGKSWLMSIADVINRQAIQRLIKFNAFPGITGYPELVFSEAGIPDLATIGEYINKLADKELITPDPELERHLRQIANLPQRPVEVREPEGVAEKGRAADETALLIRRVTLAVDNLAQMGVATQEEANAVLRPLWDELATSISNPAALVSPTGTTSGHASREDRQGTGGQNGSKPPFPVHKAEPVDRSQLTPEGRKALSLTEGLELDIRQAWSVLTRNVASGMEVKTALVLYRRRAESLIAAGLNEAWLVGRDEQFTEAEQGEIDQEIAAQHDYLRNFMTELENELSLAEDRDEVGGILGASLARAVMYGGAIWMVYNLAKVFKAPPESLWEWAGGLSPSSCSDCVEEVRAGPRPLSQMTRRPGIDTICKTNCRHELRRVK